MLYTEVHINEENKSSKREKSKGKKINCLEMFLRSLLLLLLLLLVLIFIFFILFLFLNASLMNVRVVPHVV